MEIFISYKKVAMMQTCLKLLFIAFALPMILKSANAFQANSDFVKSYGNGVTFSYKVYKITIPTTSFSLRPPIVSSRSPPLEMFNDADLTHFGRPKKQSSKNHNRKSRKFPVRPQEIICGADVKSNIKNLHKNVSCKPRNTVVEIESENPTHELFPKAVMIKRCGGVCSGRRSCISAQQENVTVHITVNTVQCTAVEISQDTACKCDCKTKELCKENQIFDQKKCKCRCMNRAKCPSTSFLWDEKTCSCKCRNEEYCTTGTTWVPKECRCVIDVNRRRAVRYRFPSY